MSRLLFVKSETVQSSFEEGRPLLEQLGVDVSTLPAISFRFRSLDTLCDALKRPNDYAGLILTSGRSVEAITATQSTDLEKWKTQRNYCVGQTTRKKMESDLGAGWTVRGGADTGNAEQLADLMLGNLEENPTDLPFLFPCSNLALGTLVTRLTSSGYRVETIEVYETVKHPDLDGSVKDLSLESVSFVMFFSPSTVQYFMDAIRKAGKLDDLLSPHLKLIAIGPSTFNELTTEGLPVFATCTKPNIESLIDIIKAQP